MSHFLYHSFPRPKGGEEGSKGLMILRSILQSGLLLTPETYDFSELLADGKAGGKIRIYQNRVCFTEISEDELPNHSKYFGAISLEFELKKLQLANASPVFYVPYDLNDEVWEGALGSILARLCDTQELLNRLDTLKKFIADRENLMETINFTENGEVIKNSCVTIQGAKELLSFLEYKRQPIPEQLGALKGLSNMFYPVESERYNPELGYYKQKEWRIFSGIVNRGQILTEKPTPEETKRLISIDEDFFSKKKNYPSGEHSTVEQSVFLRKIGNENIANSITRIFADNANADKIKELLSEYNLKIDVLKINEA